MFEIIKKHREHRPNRKNYYIKWKVRFSIDNDSYLQIWSFLPTIIWTPWYYRSKGMVILDLTWLNWHISIGEWCFKENKDEWKNY